MCDFNSQLLTPELHDMVVKEQPPIQRMENLAQVAEDVYERAIGKNARFVFWEVNQAYQSDYTITPQGIENKLRECFGQEVFGQHIRVGHVDGRLYLWNPDTKPNNLLKAYDRQFFYFRSEDELALLTKLAAHMILSDHPSQSLSHLNRLMQQLVHRDISYLRERKSRIEGASLHLLSDILGMTPSHLEGRIVKIAGANGNGGIRSPRFPENMNLEILRARFIGVAVSDCYIPESGTLEFSEGSLDRIDRFKCLLSEFGMAHGKECFYKEKGHYKLYVASPLTAALHFWEIPSGDRTILNYGLPSDVPTWSKKAMRGYMQEMLAQEGNVDKNGVINWTRSHALYDGRKATKYGFRSRISVETREFLAESKLTRKHTGMVSERSIPMGQLTKLSRLSDEYLSRIANELRNVVFAYRNRLIDDERTMSLSLRIKVKLDPVRISFFEKSDRVTVRWQARVSGHESKIRSIILIAPNFDVKYDDAIDWLFKQPAEGLAPIRCQLELEGFELSSQG